MDPRTWGPGTWHFLHVIGLVYPNIPTEEDKRYNLNFINAFSEIIPCPFCKAHFKVILDKMPPKLESRMDFFKWTIDAHNVVNQINGKKELSYDEAVIEMGKNERYYMSMPQRDEILKLLEK